MSTKRPIISVFGLVMLNVAAVLSLRGLPMMAETGLTMIFYLLFASMFFLLPSALISAELASGWPQTGGVYCWVKEAFGCRWGFLAIWLQWSQNIVWFPMVLTFSASAFAYLLLKPELAHNNLYLACFIIIVYWLSTWFSCRGLAIIEKLASVAIIIGTLLPGLLIILLGAIWIYNGEPIFFLSVKSPLIPDFSNFSNIAFLSGIVLLFSGMEVGAVHVRSLTHPRHQYPKTIFIATLIIIIMFSLGSFAIATVLPKESISLTAGILEAFDKMLTYVNLSCLLPIIGFSIALGSFGSVLAWLAGPSKGLLATAKDGELPPFLARTNKIGMPKNILIVQGVIITFLASLYLIIDDISTAFFLLTSMTLLVYLIVYFLIFIAALKLRYSQPNIERCYQIPGGKFGIWLVVLMGLSAVIFAFVVGFSPPTELHIAKPWLYQLTLITGLCLFIGSGLLIHKNKKPHWRVAHNSQSST